MENARINSAGGFQIQTHLGRPLFIKQPEVWDALLARSPAPSIFLKSSWLKSWYEVYGAESRITTTTISLNGKLVAASVLTQTDRIANFAAHGFVDYSDFLVDDDLTDPVFEQVVDTLLEEAQRWSPEIVLTRLPAASRTTQAILNLHNWYCTETARVEAPILDMVHVDDRLKKKSIVRHARKLAKQGQLTCQTTSDANATLAQLDEFFDQHIARWAETPYPSLFHDPRRRAIYRALATNLGNDLRFSAIRLDDRLIAAHFGTCFSGVYTWYKPSFDPDFARFSPGEVLLKHLLEQAVEDDAAYFDFTIGNEAFKQRFASQTRYVVTLHLTKSKVLAAKRRARLVAARMIKR